MITRYGEPTVKTTATKLAKETIMSVIDNAPYHLENDETCAALMTEKEKKEYYAALEKQAARIYKLMKYND